MIEVIQEMFHYPFFTRALLIGCLLSCTCALLGNLIVIRKEAIIGHSLANLALLGIAIGTLASTNLSMTSLLACLFGACMILLLQQTHRFTRDSILEYIAQVSMAGSVIIISQMSGVKTDLMQFLFGDILSISSADVWSSVALSVLVLVLYSVFEKPFLQIAFNEELAVSAGTQVKKFNLLFLLLVATTVAIAIKIIGVILLAAFLVIPANAAKTVASSFRQMTLLSMGFSLVSTIFALVLSFVYDIPSGATIILVMGALLATLTLIKSTRFARR